MRPTQEYSPIELQHNPSDNSPARDSYNYMLVNKTKCAVNQRRQAINLSHRAEFITNLLALTQCHREARRSGDAFVSENLFAHLITGEVSFISVSRCNERDASLPNLIGQHFIPAGINTCRFINEN